MASYKKAIENLFCIEKNADILKHKDCMNDKKLLFNETSYQEVFYSSISDEMFEKVWLKYNYNSILSQSIANKYFEASVSLSSKISKSIIKSIMKNYKEYKHNNKSDLFVDFLNQVRKNNDEASFISRFRCQQRDYYIRMMSNRPLEAINLSFFLPKIYL